MEVFVARQPIFDRDLKVHAYELLSRSGPENVFAGLDGDQATSEVIDGTLSSFGWTSLTSGKKAFINLTRRMLVEDLASVLPREKTVLEILEDVPPDESVISACRAFKRSGYMLALDDFVCRPEMEPLVELADIIKIDFLETRGGERKRYVEEYGNERGIRLLAEKLETREEYENARDLGYDLFQGYFFCQPEVVSRKEIPAYKVNYMRFLKEVNRPDVEFSDLEKIIKQEVSLSVRLLRYINSAMFGLRHHIENIQHALAMLGLRNVRRWATLLALMEMSEDKPDELIATALIRGRICELIGEHCGRRSQASELFLTGMLSVLDAILDRPLSELLEEIAVPSAVRDALTGEPSDVQQVFRLARTYERGSWDEIPPIVEHLGVPEDRLPELYRKAVLWTDDIYRVESAER